MAKFVRDVGGSEMPIQDIERDELDDWEGEIPESFDLDRAFTHDGQQYGEARLDDGSYLVFTVTQDGEWRARQLPNADDGEKVEQAVRDLHFGGRAEIVELVEDGLSPAEAIDYKMVELGSYHTSQWAKRRDVSHQAVSENVQKAKKKLGDE